MWIERDRAEGIQGWRAHSRSSSSRVPLKPCWSEKLFSFNFVDKQLAQGGILSIFLKEGLVDDTAKFVVKGKGANLGLPANLTSLQSPVTVQLKNSLGNCWGAVYSFPFTKNDRENFKDKSD